MSHALWYLEHLSDEDLALMARTAGLVENAASTRTRLDGDPGELDRWLASNELFAAMFDVPFGETGPPVTPFLAFGVLVNRCAAELEATGYVHEWAGLRRRIPVFDVAPLRDFLSSTMRRFFMAELLTSFTRVASGSTWVKTRRGYRRRRFSELDLVRLAEVVDQLPLPQRPAGYRRLADVALFLAGVFPDHTAGNPFRVVDRERLVSSSGLAAVTAIQEGDDLRLHDALGAAWYRRAVESSALLVGRGPEHLLDVADRFSHARRVLNVIADRHLHRWDGGLMRPAG